MWKPLLAFLLAASALAVSQGQALAAEGDTSSQPTCTPFKVVYSERNWQDPTPLNGRDLCSPKTHRGAQNTIRHFRQYREYRSIATMRCTGGDEGYFVPNPGSCSTIACESHYSWSAYNPSSGANGAYQLLGHGQPYPATTFADRLVHHEIAATLPRSAWVC